MVPLEYQVRLQAKPPVNQQGKQTNREREGKPASGNEWDRNREKHKPKVKVRISNIFGYREVIAIADLLAMYVCMCECVRCVESACHWIIITTSPNVRGRRRWGPPPDVRLAWFNIDACVKLPDLFYDSTHQPHNWYDFNSPTYKKYLSWWYA